MFNIAVFWYDMHESVTYKIVMCDIIISDLAICEKRCMIVYSVREHW